MPAEQDRGRRRRDFDAARALLPFTLRWVAAGILGAVLVLVLVAAVRLAMRDTPDRREPPHPSPTATHRRNGR